MRILLITLIVLASQISLAASECIYKHSIRNFKSIDATTLEVDAGSKDYTMQVSLCSEIEWAHNIAFDTFESSRVCRGDRLLILDNFTNQVIQRCQIFSIEKI